MGPWTIDEGWGGYFYIGTPYTGSCLKHLNVISRSAQSTWSTWSTWSAWWAWSACHLARRISYYQSHILMPVFDPAFAWLLGFRLKSQSRLCSKPNWSERSSMIPDYLLTTYWLLTDYLLTTYWLLTDYRLTTVLLLGFWILGKYQSSRVWSLQRVK